MLLQPADPDIRTLVGRIRDGSIDLQPDFQRGVVWPRTKQQKLIDSILRDWHIPPIHLIRDDAENEVVLDGQQRLEAIRAFVSNEFPVDGNVAPSDAVIEALDGLFYSALPEKVKRRVDRFAIRVFTIVDYEPEEPFELFYRLNQPMALTASEQRNAFFGRARDQVRNLVDFAERKGLSRDTIGFSNSRMAYDDVFARFCLTLEQKRLNEKVTSNAITEMYRSPKGFSQRSLDLAHHTTDFVLSLSVWQSQIKLNKATLYSWLCFFAAAINDGAGAAHRSRLSTFVEIFELARNISRGAAASNTTSMSLPQFTPKQTFALIHVFNDRSTARVADVASVVLRDFILWIAWSRHGGTEFAHAKMASKVAPDLFATDTERTLLELADEMRWGRIL